MKIVQFSDGNYAIRRWHLFKWEYCILNTNMEWTTKKYSNYRNCLTKDFDIVKTIFKVAKAYYERGKPVNMVIEAI